MSEKPIFVPKDFKSNILETIIKSVENLEQKKKIIREWQELTSFKKSLSILPTYTRRN